MSLLTQVERSSLPPELQKKESLYLKTASYLNKGYLREREKPEAPLDRSGFVPSEEFKKREDHQTEEIRINQRLDQMEKLDPITLKSPRQPAFLGPDEEEEDDVPRPKQARLSEPVDIEAGEHFEI